MQHNTIGGSSFDRHVKQYEKQVDALNVMDEIARTNQEVRKLAEELKKLVWYNTPNLIKWADTITDVNEVRLRYEGRLHLYMLNSTASAAITLKCLGLVIPFASIPVGWVNMNYPEGSVLTATNASSRYPVLFVATNSIIGGVQ